MTGAASRWRNAAGSVRLRTTLAATLIVAITLAVGSVVLLWRFKASLDDNRRSAAMTRAYDIASLAATGQLPAVLTLPNQDATYAQVLDRTGHVLAASANIAGERALAPPIAYGAPSAVGAVASSPIDGDGASRLVRVSAGSASAPLTVLAGYSLVGSQFAVRDIELGLLVGVPIVLIVVWGTSWLIVGRALRPIDAIRAEVTEITALGLHRRVPQPPGGDEVARLAETMNNMLDRLEMALEKQQAFVADASHELRSPLASLRAQLEIGRATAENKADWQAVIDGALAEESRIESLVRDLLLLARLDRHAADPSRPLGRPDTVVDLGQVASAESYGRPRRSGITLRCDAAGEVKVPVPEGLARRVVANLVDNAERHAATRVTITVSENDGWADLAVQDDGPGIAPADRERVFQRFTRLDEARASDDGGAGLGLAIVKDIVARHGGTVAFTDCPAGARVVVRLPLRTSSSSAQSGPAPGPPPPSKPTAVRSSRQRRDRPVAEGHEPRSAPPLGSSG